jgi:signal transduction histidine kinase
MGLSIVKKIITAHGGRLEIESPDPGILRISIILEKVEMLEN